MRTVKRHGRVLLAAATLDLPLGISVALTAGRRARNAHARLRRGAHHPGAHQDRHPADVHRVDVQDALGRRHKLEIDQLRRGPQLQGGWGVGAAGRRCVGSQQRYTAPGCCRRGRSSHRAAKWEAAVRWGTAGARVYDVCAASWLMIHTHSARTM